MGTLRVVVLTPSLDFLAGTAKRPEPVQIQGIVPQSAVQARHDGILSRLAGIDEPQPDTGALGPVRCP